MDIKTNAFNRPEEILQALHDLFQREERVVLAAKEEAEVSGLAREYIRRCGREYQAIVWINATTNEMFLADLYEALERFSLPTDRTIGAGGLFRTLHMYLQEQGHSLLVLDHLPAAFRVLNTPETSSLSYDLLLITHLENTPAELPRLELADLDAQAGARLVLSCAGLLAEQAKLDTVESGVRLAALELAREVQGDPLALRLAGGYLRQSGKSMSDYLEVFRGYPVHLQLQRSEQQELEVAGEICLDWSERTHAEAREILQSCACLLPDMIPVALCWPDEAAMAHRRKEAIQLLVTLGLLVTNENGTMLSMHPLLQQLVRQFYRLDQQPQQQNHVDRLLHRLQHLLPALEKEAVSPRLRISGHILHLERLSSAWEITSTGSAEVFAWAARQLWEQSMYIQARTLLQRALAIWEQSAEISQRVIAPALAKLAELSAQLGDYAEAEALAHRAISGLIAAQGANHPDVLGVLQQLGQYYAAQQKKNEAQACYKKVLKTAEALKLRHHPAYSLAKYHLALLAMEQGKDEQAEDLLRRVCAVWKRQLGESHRSTTGAYLKLGEVAARLQHWQRAYNAYQLALPWIAQDMGQAHLLQVDQLEQVAQVMFQVGKLAEAQRTWQSVLEVRERTRDEAPIPYLACLNELARVTLAQGQQAEALALLEQAQRYIAERDEVRDSPVEAETLLRLAEVCECEQDYERAEQIASKALAMRENVMGSTHPELVETLGELAKLKLGLGETEEAEKFMLRALVCYQHAGKPEDMKLDPVLQRLAALETARACFDTARMYLQRQRAIRELALGTDDPRVQEIRQKLAENASARNAEAPVAR